PRVRRAAFRSVLPRLDRLIAHEGSQSAAARQRALHRRRVRHAPRARPREGLVVRRDRRDRPHPATTPPPPPAPPKGSFFRAIGETAPTPQPPGRIGHPPARIDWVGRPEQTNVRLNNPGLSSAADDLRDLWNQQTPFAVSPALQPLFLQRLQDSFVGWELRGG